MAFLNYHHLRYFRAIAREGSLARAAERLNLTAPALSIQLKQLEDSLGHTLFDRQRGGWSLTEAGRLTLDYSETIFRAGEELQGVLQEGAAVGKRALRIGAVATLSRNFQLAFVEPALREADISLVLRSGALRELLQQLEAHEIDVILANQPVRRDAEHAWHSHLLAEQPAALFGSSAWRGRAFRFPEDVRTVPLILPSVQSDLRASFDRLMERHGLRPRIAAEVDDMSMLRLLTRAGDGLALVPEVVVRDEFARGELTLVHAVPGIVESFYAITPTRRFPNPLVRRLVEAAVKRKHEAPAGAVLAADKKKPRAAKRTRG